MVQKFNVTHFTFILFLKLAEHYLFMKGSMMHEKFISQIVKKVIFDKYDFQNFHLVNINKSVRWIRIRDLRFTSPIPLSYDNTQQNRLIQKKINRTDKPPSSDVVS